MQTAEALAPLPDRTDLPDPAHLHTIESFSKRWPLWTPASLYGLIARSERNSIVESSAILFVGGRILIDERAFFAWARSGKARQQRKARRGGGDG